MHLQLEATMPWNPNASYWAQFARGEDGYLSRPAPAPARRLFEAHDAPTRRMIKQWDELYRLEGADTIVPLIEKWEHLERMGSREQKQELLEGLIQQIQREPESHAADAVFVLLAVEPIRRKIARKLLAGVRLTGHGAATDRHRRNEARILRDMEREEIFDETRMAALELIFRYPFTVAPGRFFGWFRESLAWRVTDIYRQKHLHDDDGLTSAEREVLSDYLHGFDDLGSPELRSATGYPHWRFRLGGLANVYRLVESYHASPQVRTACRAAIGRLAPKQQETIEAYFYDGLTLEEIAQRRGVTLSTVGNTKAVAERKLAADDIFYCALDAIGRIRNETRRREIEQRYPEGQLPDGKRIVWIGDEAA
jgi:RNA polymerase sigma factor (sigma-70 family)